MRNASAIDASGNYAGTSGFYQTTEDFWGRDFKNNLHLQKSFKSVTTPYNRALYSNGYPPGRTSYVAVKQVLGLALPLTWRTNPWSFRARGHFRSRKG